MDTAIAKVLYLGFVVSSSISIVAPFFVPFLHN